MRTLSLVVVSYGSSGVAAGAIDTLRREASACGVAAEVVVVDHEGSPEERERLAALAPDRLLHRENRGYAAGLNAGIAASSGEVLLLANPDLLFHPGSLGPLLAALDGGWDVVGPRFELGGAHFPAAEPQTPREELRRLAARRSEQGRRAHLRREARSSLRLWAEEEPQSMVVLSGALLAARRQTVLDVGPWDEGYFLYFEEVDWLRRAQAQGRRIAWVPRSRVAHAWGHAAVPERQGETFERSRRRYYQRHFPHWRPPVVEPGAPPVLPPLPPTEELVRLGRLAWLVSPSPHGFPAAGLGTCDGRGLGDALGRFDAARSHGGPLVVSAYSEEEDRLVGSWRFEPR